MSEMLDRVATAIAREVPLGDSRWTPAFSPRFPQDYTREEVEVRYRLARLAIAAMRDPTPSMLASAWEIVQRVWNQPTPRAPIDPGAAFREAWHAMIDEALR